MVRRLVSEVVRRLVSEVVRRLVSEVVRRLVSEVSGEAGKVLVTTIPPLRLLVLE